MGWLAQLLSWCWPVRQPPALQLPLRPPQLPAPHSAALAQLCARIRLCRDIPRLLPLLQDESGWLREAALAACAAQPDARVIAHLPRALNDPVEAVRLAARVALRAHLHARFASAWLAVWPQLRALHHCSRAQQRFAVWEVERLLLRQPALLRRDLGLRLQTLQQAPGVPQRAALRECLWLAAQAQALTVEERLEYALCADDVLLARCFCAWLMELPPAARAPWLARAMRGRAALRQRCQRALPWLQPQAASAVSSN